MLVACAVGLTAFVVLFTWAMLKMGAQVLKFIAEMPWLSKLFEVAFGINVNGEVSLTILFAICFTHAVVFMLSWSFVIATTTRVTVGEIERGTADLLLTLPVRRSEVYASTTLLWVLASMLLAFCPVVGVWIGTLVFETDEVVEVARYFKPAWNSVFLLWAIGGISSLAASLIDRRGPAIATVVTIVLISAVLSFIEPFIEVVKRIRFISLLNYFRPVDVVRENQWQLAEMSVLFGVGLVGWLIGLAVFCRKDIPTA
jgi:ABC-2 type transport system permease protein